MFTIFRRAARALMRIARSLARKAARALAKVGRAAQSAVHQAARTARSAWKWHAHRMRTSAAYRGFATTGIPALIKALPVGAVISAALAFLAGLYLSGYADEPGYAAA
ncbi:MAG: hypothetical protein IPO93_18420 [Actinobacteria bacterium]|jgi:ABC-type transporter Mla maintaining outer membrane lipid asymmetry permease subunit MlaE|nr:hypothetical protein [Actinomycetota bacterium]